MPFFEHATRLEEELAACKDAWYRERGEAYYKYRDSYIELMSWRRKSWRLTKENQKQIFQLWKQATIEKKKRNRKMLRFFLNERSAAFKKAIFSGGRTVTDGERQGRLKREFERKDNQIAMLVEQLTCVCVCVCVCVCARAYRQNGICQTQIHHCRCCCSRR